MLSPFDNQGELLIMPSEASRMEPLVPVPIDAVEPNAIQMERREDGVLVGSSERGRRRRAKMSPVPSPRGMEVALLENGPGTISVKDRVHMAIGRFLYEAGVPLDAVNSVHFQAMINTVASAGPVVEPPSYHDLRGPILKSCMEEIRTRLEQLKATWARTGCSILADEWITESDRTFINFLVYCPDGMMFLKSVDASEIIASPDALFELLKHVVEEVGVKDVVQVITIKRETYALAGKLLTDAYPTLFWTPCSFQCLEDVLRDFSKLPEINIVLEQAQMITGFIYSHAPVLNMMKRYTCGRDLIHPSTSPSTTNFLTLKTMISLKDNLLTMMTSQEWMECVYSKLPGSVGIVDLICNPTFWSSCSDVVYLAEPLVQLLKIVNSNIRPAMGYMYISIHRAKERIRRELKKKNYSWEINWKWTEELSQPLHMAGFYFNPQFFYKVQGEIPNTINSGMLDCVERLVPEAKVQDKILKELALYKNASGDFGRNIAIRARETLLPAEWWSTYGGACPNLSRLAIRILSQTSSTRGCNARHISFEQIHNQGANILEHQRISDLAFVQYNLRLHQRQLSRSKCLDPISVDNNEGVQVWVVVDKGGLFTDQVSSNWMELVQPTTSSTPEHENDEDTDPFMIAFDDEGMPGATTDEEDVREDHDDRNGTYPIGEPFPCD